jgi:hypothetical protein
MNNSEELAHIIRNNVFNSQADPFHISEAQVFAYDSEGCLRILAEHQDPYEALWTAAYEPLNTNENGIGIITVGWAAPTCDTDTAPSEHPDRRRVHLITITSRGYKDAAILTFHDETENEITFAEGGTGQLADALHTAMHFITHIQEDTSPPTDPCLGVGKLIT